MNGIEMTAEAKKTFLFGSTHVDVMKVTNHSVFFRSSDGYTPCLFKVDMYQLTTIKSFIRAHIDKRKTRTMVITDIPVECDGETFVVNIAMASCGDYIIISLENDDYIFSSFSALDDDCWAYCKAVKDYLEIADKENFSKMMKDTKLKGG